MSKIEWTDVTWNPVTGCDKVSTGCKNCYAERQAAWLHRMGNPRYRNGFNVTLHWDLLEEPRRWRKPRRIFVCSMSDLFNEQVPRDFIERVFYTMEACPQHTFQVLTKRPERADQIICGESGMGTNQPRWPNLWLGTSVEDQMRADARIPPLLRIPAAVRFVSCEPLIGRVNLRVIHYKDGGNQAYIDALRGNAAVLGQVIEYPALDWVIAGGESGPNARPMLPAWADDLLEQCLHAHVPFFFKQWGAGAKDRRLNGHEWNQMPETKVTAV